jgi:hypothetical protein
MTEVFGPSPRVVATKCNGFSPVVGVESETDERGSLHSGRGQSLHPTRATRSKARSFPETKRVERMDAAIEGLDVLEGD